MVSFKGGQLWLHDKDTNTANYNNFYGVKYPSILTMVFNEMPAEIKNWWAILLNQIQSNQGNDWYVPNITNVRGQVSNIPNVNFEYWFQYWHAFTLRDVNTPNKTFPLIEGNLLQSNTLLVTLENPSNNQFSLVEARMNFTSSKGTTK